MWALLGPALLAFLIATAAAASELITTKYPRTYFLLARSAALYSYSVIYGLIAFGIMWAVDTLTAHKLITLSGLGVESRWTQAVAIGLSCKAILHINLFSVGSASRPSPVGLETLVQIFEPELLRRILLKEFDAVRAYIGPRTSKYANLQDVKTQIKTNIPRTLPKEERAAFQNDIDTSTTIADAMEAFLRFVGRATFSRVFPP